MSISGQQPVSLIDSILNAQSTRVELGVEVLKKAQDTEKQQAEAEIKMLEQAGAPISGGKLDTYA